MEGKTIIIRFKSFSDARPRPVKVSPSVGFEQLLSIGGCKLHLKATSAFKVLDHPHLVPFLEYMKVEDGMTLILLGGSDKVPSFYNIVESEQLIPKTAITRKPESALLIDPSLITETDAWRDCKHMVSDPVDDSVRTLIEDNVNSGVVGIKRHAAYVQFKKGQAGRIIGRNGNVMKRLRGSCHPNTWLYFDDSTYRVTVLADDENHLLHAIHVVLQERSAIESFGRIHHVHIRECSIIKGGFGPVMGVGGKIKHDIESRHSVKLSFDMKTFVVRIIGCDQYTAESALRELQEVLNLRDQEAQPPA